ncbi:MAG: hypothetical protein Kow0092_14750 [Deferrisomatales bacterium]
MPLYEYVCRSCGREFEALVMGGGEPRCPDCGGARLTRKLSAFAFRSGGKGGPRRPGAGSTCAGCAAGSCATCR